MKLDIPDILASLLASLIVFGLPIGILLLVIIAVVSSNIHWNREQEKCEQSGGVYVKARAGYACAKKG